MSEKKSLDKLKDKMSGASNDEDKNEQKIPDNIPSAPLPGKRFIGYCLDCKDFVELNHEFVCQNEGHPPSKIAVVLEIDINEPLPKMPSFNVGAFLAPPVWGPFHQMSFLILYFLVWFFVYNAIRLAMAGSLHWVMVAIIAILTVAFQVYFGFTANTLAYVQNASEVSPSEFLDREKKWVWISLAVAIVVIVLAVLALFFL